MKWSKDLKYTISQTDDLPKETESKKAYKEKTTVKEEITDETEFTTKLSELNTEIGSIKDGKYWVESTGDPLLNINTFTYNGSTTSTNQKNYQDKIITKLWNIFTWETTKNKKKNYDLLVAKINSKDSEAIKLFSKTSVINIANMLKASYSSNTEITKIVNALKTTGVDIGLPTVKDGKIQITATRMNTTKNISESQTITFDFDDLSKFKMVA